MDLKNQKRMAADLFDCSKKRVWLDPNRMEEIDEAITKEDIRDLIEEDIIQKKSKKGVSRGRAKKNAEQKSTGKRRGHGKRKGTKNARKDKKTKWMEKVRAQRDYLKSLKEKDAISSSTFRELYNKSKGGFFRNVSHIKSYIKEHQLRDEDDE